MCKDDEWSFSLFSSSTILVLLSRISSRPAYVSAEQFIDEFDYNDDGKISFVEFHKGWKLLEDKSLGKAA
jgi:hypothetical protein